jgi:hypothetical protein
MPNPAPISSASQIGPISHVQPSSASLSPSAPAQQKYVGPTSNPFEPHQLERHRFYKLNKPEGYAVVKMPTDRKPPANPPTPPGRWEIINAGPGEPPVFGYVSDEEIKADTGLEYLKPPPPPQYTGSGRGHYVPIRIREDTGTWAWIPEIGPTFGLI